MDYVMLREGREGNESNLIDLCLDASISLHNHWDNIDPVDNPYIPLDFFTASSIGHYEHVRDLLATHSTEIVNNKNKAHWTALMYASYMGHDTILDLLFETGANPNIKTNHGVNALMLASSCGHESIVYTLLQQGALPNDVDQCGLSTLFYSCRQGNAGIITMLLANGANPDLKDPNSGMTPLLEAARDGRDIVVNALLKNGANPYIKNKDGHVARTVALRAGNISIVETFDKLTPRREKAYLTSSDPGNADFKISNEDNVRAGLQNPNIHQDIGIRKGPEEFNDLFSKRATIETERQSSKTDNKESDSAARKIVTFQEQTDAATANVQSTAKNELESDVKKSTQKIDNNELGCPKNEVEQLSTSSESESDMAFFQGGMETVKYDGPLSPSSSMNDFGEKKPNDPRNNKTQTSADATSKTKATAPTSNTSDCSSEKQVESFLEKLKLSKYLATFIEQEIDMETLLTLTEADLVDIGIKLLGPRRKISIAIARQVDENKAKSSNLEKDNVPTPKQLHDLEARFSQASSKINSLTAQLAHTTNAYRSIENHLLEEKAHFQRVTRHISKVKEAASKASQRLTTARQTCQNLHQTLGQSEQLHQNESKDTPKEKHDEENTSSSNTAKTDTDDKQNTSMATVVNANDRLVEELNSVNNMIEIVVSTLDKINY